MQTVIVINSEIDDPALINALLGHELAHYLCGHGDHFNLKPFEAAIMEARADRSALGLYLNFERLIAAYADGCRENWELAERLEIPVPTFEKSMAMLQSIYGTQVIEVNGYALCFLPYYIRKIDEEAE